MESIGKKIWTFFIIWYICGVILVAFDLLPPWLEWANSVFLYVSGLIVILYLLNSLEKKFYAVIISLFIIVLTIFAEHLGVEYGLIFGEYHYEKDFGIQFLGVPVTIGFAWLLVVGSSMVYFLHIKNAFLYAILTSILAVNMDLIIDPVSFVVKEYWIWEGTGFYYGIPNQNFIGWFSVSFVIQLGLFYLKQWKGFSSDPIWEARLRVLYFLVMFMFVLTAMMNGLWVGPVLVLTIFTVMATFSVRGRSA
ncbi:carotenoid biosynthesis protein [Bacillus coahuilensis]|uniref:carotenoid biosynthesis protein n=1 Tax=Bacillus coahuilensis TaxID=408580 RepID=UPI000750593C|nr:carotenoid biosynthesis protein [Bacillus coahuilensis]